MKFINSECKITKEEAHELLMQNQKSYLWNFPYNTWDEEDLHNIKNGINKRTEKQGLKTRKIAKPIKTKIYKRHIRHQKVELTFNNGTKKQYASIKSVANKFKINQSTVSNILAGRKQTTKFLSITKA